MTTLSHWTRRQALAGGACALGLALVGKVVGAQSVAPTPDPDLVGLNAAGAALAPATRLGPKPPTVPAGKLRFPLDPASDCYVLDNFADCRSGCSRLHEGVDIMGSRGQPIYAVANGILTKRFTNTGTAGWGWTLTDTANDVVYRYFHCTEDANGLKEGDRVSDGDVIAFVGKSGTFGVDNYHLHFEVRPRGGAAIDPLPLLFVDRTACRISPPIKG